MLWTSLGAPTAGSTALILCAFPTTIVMGESAWPVLACSLSFLAGVCENDD